MSEAAGACDQYQAHAWKKELCANCMKPEKVHTKLGGPVASCRRPQPRIRRTPPPASIVDLPAPGKVTESKTDTQDKANSENQVELKLSPNKPSLANKPAIATKPVSPTSPSKSPESSPEKKKVLSESQNKETEEPSTTDKENVLEVLDNSEKQEISKSQSFRKSKTKLRPRPMAPPPKVPPVKLSPNAQVAPSEFPKEKKCPEKITNKHNDSDDEPNPYYHKYDVTASLRAKRKASARAAVAAFGGSEEDVQMLMKATSKGGGMLLDRHMDRLQASEPVKCTDVTAIAMPYTVVDVTAGRMLSREDLNEVPPNLPLNPPPDRDSSSCSSSGSLPRRRSPRNMSPNLSDLTHMSLPRTKKEMGTLKGVNANQLNNQCSSVKQAHTGVARSGVDLVKNNLGEDNDAANQVDPYELIGCNDMEDESTHDLNRQEQGRSSAGKSTAMEARIAVLSGLDLTKSGQAPRPPNTAPVINSNIEWIAADPTPLTAPVSNKQQIIPTKLLAESNLKPEKKKGGKGFFNRLFKRSSSTSSTSSLKDTQQASIGKVESLGSMDEMEMDDDSNIELNQEEMQRKCSLDSAHVKPMSPKLGFSIGDDCMLSEVRSALAKRRGSETASTEKKDNIQCITQVPQSQQSIEKPTQEKPPASPKPSKPQKPKRPPPRTDVKPLTPKPSSPPPNVKSPKLNPKSIKNTDKVQEEVTSSLLTPLEDSSCPAPVDDSNIKVDQPNLQNEILAIIDTLSEESGKGSSSEDSGGSKSELAVVKVTVEEVLATDVVPVCQLRAPSPDKSVTVSKTTPRRSTELSKKGSLDLVELEVKVGELQDEKECAISPSQTTPRKRPVSGKVVRNKMPAPPPPPPVSPDSVRSLGGVSNTSSDHLSSLDPLPTTSHPTSPKSGGRTVKISAPLNLLESSVPGLKSSISSDHKIADELSYKRRNMDSATKYARNKTVSECIQPESALPDNPLSRSVGAEELSELLWDRRNSRFFNRALPPTPPSGSECDGTATPYEPTPRVSMTSEMMDNIYELVSSDGKSSILGERRTVYEDIDEDDIYSDPLDPHGAAGGIPAVVKDPPATVVSVQENPVVTNGLQVAHDRLTRYPSNDYLQPISSGDMPGEGDALDNKSPIHSSNVHPRPAPRGPPPPKPGCIGKITHTHLQTDYTNAEADPRLRAPPEKVCLSQMSVLTVATLDQLCHILTQRLIPQTSIESPDTLRWKDFSLTKTTPIINMGKMNFYQARTACLVPHDCMLMVTRQPVAADLCHGDIHLNTTSICAVFCDRVPSGVLPPNSPGSVSSDYHFGGPEVASIAMLPFTNLQPLQKWIDERDTVFSVDLTEYERQVCLCLVQVMSGTLVSIENPNCCQSLRPADILLATVRDIVQYPIVALSLIESLRRMSWEKLCNDAIQLLFFLLKLDVKSGKLSAKQIPIRTKLSEGLRHVVQLLEGENLTAFIQSKAVLELMLWGPQDEARNHMEEADDMEQALLFWLEVARCSQVCRYATISAPTDHAQDCEDVYHLDFLCRGSAANLYQAFKALKRNL